MTVLPNEKGVDGASVVRGGDIHEEALNGHHDDNNSITPYRLSIVHTYRYIYIYMYIPREATIP